MAIEHDTPNSPIDELEQRLAARLFKYFVASLFVIVGSAFALGSWVAKSEAKADSATKRMDFIELTVQADSQFKAEVKADIAVLKEQNSNTQKLIDRVDNKFDRVIRVYNVPK